jgi:hypothetical protein
LKWHKTLISKEQNLFLKELLAASGFNLRSFSVVGLQMKMPAYQNSSKQVILI